MSSLRTTTITVKNYKCFREDPSGFDRILPINLIVGKNNSGKSSLLDVVEHALTHKATDLGGSAQVITSGLLTLDIIEKSVPKSEQMTWGSTIIKVIDRVKKWNNQRIFWSVKATNDSSRKFKFHEIVPPFDDENLSNQTERLVLNMANSFEHNVFQRLSPDRDIVPEVDEDHEGIEPNGRGLTTLLTQYLTRNYLPSDLIEDTLLKAINEVFAPDGFFTQILSQRDKEGNWEIELAEKGKGRIALSKSGSGLKTILLVMAMLHVIPNIKRPMNLSGISRKLAGGAKYIYAFEEIENNLHPALLRRTLAYLRRYALESGASIFLTTHSSIAIDMFARDPEAQIIHVQGSSGSASRTVTAVSYVAHKNIMEDLDVRASDLLQANAVVWVEGPSDRAYFNRWVELYSDGELREGTHYSCLQYGGSLLTGMTAEHPTFDDGDDEPTEKTVKELINILHLNRNAVVIMDSDKKDDTTPIQCYKTRIRDDIDSAGGLGWITAGRDIENYLPHAALQRLGARAGLPDVGGIGRYEEIEDYLDKYRIDKGHRKGDVKTRIARLMPPFIEREDIVGILDLDDKMTKVCRLIRKWNNMPQTD